MSTELTQRDTPPYIVSIEQAVLETLAYSDIFDYPLRLEELHRYLSLPLDLPDLVSTLHNRNDRIGTREGYYFLAGREHLIALRQKREAASRPLIQRAVWYGRILGSLPFVRMVAVTGSLATSNLDYGKDIDYLIVTATTHLWTCRALSVLIVHLARLTGINLCPNYLISENALELPDHSLYVAHELTQMIPLSGMEFFDLMRRLNAWTDEFLPNAQGAPEVPANVKQCQKTHRLQSFLEYALKIFPMQWFERWEMNRKIKKLRHEQVDSSEIHYSADICKGHMNNHGLRTEMALRERLLELGLF